MAVENCMGLTRMSYPPSPPDLRVYSLSSRFLRRLTKKRMRPTLRVRRKTPTMQTTRMMMTGTSSDPCSSDVEISDGGITPVKMNILMLLILFDRTRSSEFWYKITVKNYGFCFM